MSFIPIETMGFKPHFMTPKIIKKLTRKMAQPKLTEADWDVILDIFTKYDFLTFTPNKETYAWKAVDDIFCLDGILRIYTEANKCIAVILALEMNEDTNIPGIFGAVTWDYAADTAYSHNLTLCVDNFDEYYERYVKYDGANRTLGITMNIPPEEENFRPPLR